MLRLRFGRYSMCVLRQKLKKIPQEKTRTKLVVADGRLAKKKSSEAHIGKRGKEP